MQIWKLKQALLFCPTDRVEQINQDAIILRVFDSVFNNLGMRQSRRFELACDPEKVSFPRRICTYFVYAFRSQDIAIQPVDEFEVYACWSVVVQWKTAAPLANDR